MPPPQDRSKPATMPPPQDRSKPVTASPPPSPVTTPPPPPSASGSFQAQKLADAPAKGAAGPRYPRAGYEGSAPPFQTEKGTFVSERTPPIIVDASLSTPDLLAAANAATQRAVVPAPKVPLGEFDSSTKTHDEHARGAPVPPRPASEPSQVTPLEDIEEIEESSTAPRGDATMIDPQTSKFERGDPTQNKGPDATVIEGPSISTRATGGTLRRTAALRRKRGALGDVFYVFTALFGVRRSRRELAELEHRQDVRQTSRRRHLVTLGRTAAVTDSFDHPALGTAREKLQRIEEERGRHAGAVAASDAELERVRRDREAKAKEFLEGTSKADAELADIAKKLEPLEKEAAIVRRRAQELRESLQRIERKLADTEALLLSVKAEKMDKAAIQADIATYKADRLAVQRDEPAIAAELDALNPRIAALESTRAELNKKKAELQKAEQEDQRRTLELLEAIGAKRKVVERAASEAEAARDAALFELGERIYVDRPKLLANLLSPVDAIDLELGEGERRIMELREILSNIDRWKLARGSALIILALALVGCFVWWFVTALG